MPNAVMWQEITGQGGALAAALPELRRRSSDLPRPTPGGMVWAGGCGDSWYATQAAIDAFAAAGVDYRPASALELGHLPTAGPRRGDIAILVSISGGTVRTVEAATRLTGRGVSTVAVTCCGTSALDRACDASLLLPYTPVSRATPHTADYLVSLLALSVAAEHLGATAFPELDAMIAEWAVVAEPLLVEAGAAAANWRMDSRLVALGGLGDLGTAQYGAAKFHEAGGLSAVAAESENFVHGMNFTLGQGDLVVPIAGPTVVGVRAAELAAALGALGECRPIVSAVHSGSVAQSNPLARIEAASPVIFPFFAAVGLQGLCWGAASRLCPDLEMPKAGFPDGRLHGDVQNDLMKRGRTKLGEVKQD